MDKKCRNCKHWEGSEYDDEYVETEEEFACMRFPPQAVVKPYNHGCGSNTYWQYPATKKHWYCGEFEPVEDED